MTIRFIQQWNGHSPDEVNSSLGSTEEARLVGLNIASYDLDGANDGAEEFVKAKRNLLTGRIRKSAGSMVEQETGLQLERAVFVGDSMTAGNISLVAVTSATRTNGVVTIVTSSDLTIETGMYGSTTNIVPEDMNANNVRFTKAGANTYTYESNGANAVGASLSAEKPMFAQNPQNQRDLVIFWLKSKSSGAFVVDRIYGNNGNTAADMLRRVQSGEIDFQGASIAILQTGYNDFVSARRTAEAVIDDMTAVALIAQASGCKVVIESSLPWAIGGDNNARANAVRYNRLAGNFCACATNIRFSNSAALMIDGTNATAFYPVAGMLNIDGIHPSPRGSERRAEALYQATKDWYKAVDRLVCSAADNYGFDPLSPNILDSGPWSSIGGTVTAPATGVAATSFTVTTHASVATTASVPARADGLGYDQQIDSTSSGAGVTSTVKIGQISNTRYAARDKYILMMEMSLSGVVESKLRGINVSIGTLNQYAIRSDAADDSRFPRSDMVIRVFSEPMVIPDVEPGNMEITISFIFHAAGAALTAKIGRCSMVRVS